MVRKLAVVSGIAIALAAASVPARAVPDEPSALMAAQLAVDPQAGWIGHYLPDDRYKIAGGIWKVVSTETDQYYHTPECPKMLAQSADNVIGFASAKDAEDAGYLPDPSCGPNEDVGGAFDPSGSGPHKATLSDGVSTIVVPAGFVPAGSFSSASLKLPNNNFKFAMNMFRGPGTERLATLSMDLSQFPGLSQLNLGKSFTPEGFAHMRDQQSQLYLQLSGTSADSTNAFMAGFSNAIKNLSGISEAKLGPIRGVLAHTVEPISGRTLSLVMAADGGKIYDVEADGVSDESLRAISRTFTPH